MQTQYKHIHFVKDATRENVYNCINNKSGDILGFVYWHKPWKRFVFEGIEGCIFDINCLEDIKHFINEIS